MAVEPNIIEDGLTQIQPGVWRLIAPNPSLLTGQGTNTYLVGGGGQVVIIDPGPAIKAHIETVITAIGTINTTVYAVIVTHHHPDHSESAELLARRLSVPLFGFDKPLKDGQEINLPGLSLQVCHTPGHTHDHICLWLPKQALLFGGDLVSGAGTVLIIPPDGDMAAYLASLRAMLSLSPSAILPGHGTVITTAQALLQEYINHRLMREKQVLDYLAQGYNTAAEIAAQIYADRPEVLAIATMQIEAHLIKLRVEGRG